MNGDQSGSQLTPAQATALKAAQMHRQPMFSDPFNTTQQQPPATSTPQPMPMVSQSQTQNAMSPQVPVQPPVQQSKTPVQPQSPAKKPSPAQSLSGQGQGKAPPVSPDKSISQEDEKTLSKSPCSSGKGNIEASPKRQANIGKAEPAEKQLPSSPSTPQSQQQDKKPVCILLCLLVWLSNIEKHFIYS